MAMGVLVLAAVVLALAVALVVTGRYVFVLLRGGGADGVGVDDSGGRRAVVLVTVRDGGRGSGGGRVSSTADLPAFTPPAACGVSGLGTGGGRREEGAGLTGRRAVMDKRGSYRAVIGNALGRWRESGAAVCGSGRKDGRWGRRGKMDSG